MTWHSTKWKSCVIALNCSSSFRLLWAFIKPNYCNRFLLFIITFSHCNDHTFWKFLVIVNHHSCLSRGFFNRTFCILIITNMFVGYYYSHSNFKEKHNYFLNTAISDLKANRCWSYEMLRNQVLDNNFRSPVWSHFKMWSCRKWQKSVSSERINAVVSLSGTLIFWTCT